MNKLHDNKPLRDLKVSVMLTQEERQQLERLAKHYEASLSDVIRAGIQAMEETIQEYQEEG